MIIYCVYGTGAATVFLRSMVHGRRTSIKLFLEGAIFLVRITRGRQASSLSQNVMYYEHNLLFSVWCTDLTSQ